MIHPTLEKALIYSTLILFIVGLPIIFWEKAGYDYAKPAFWLFVLFPTIFIIDFLCQLFGRLYGFKVWSIVARLFMQSKTRAFKVVFFVELFVSFYLTVCLFGLIYLHMGYRYPDSFALPYDMSFVKAIYFSLTTLTVGPTGLEPKSMAAHLIVMLEILIGLAYAILVFSAISSHIQQKQLLNQN